MFYIPGVQIEHSGITGGLEHGLDDRLHIVEQCVL